MSKNYLEERRLRYFKNKEWAMSNLALFLHHFQLTAKVKKHRSR